MKKKTLISTIVISILGAISITAGFWFGFTDPALLKEQSLNHEEYATWMKNVKDDTKLLDLVIPGSHDSATYTMMPQAMCQGHDIEEQLKCGVRYFDIRVDQKGDDLVIFHGPIKGVSFKNVVADFTSFIKDHPSEFIIIDFQHLGDKVNQKVIDMIKNTLPMQKMLKLSECPALNEASMSLLRENNKNFMIIWNDEEEALANEFYYRNEYLRSEYNSSVHKSSDEELISYFDTYYKNKVEGQLFVLQAQRTCKNYLGRPAKYEKHFKNSVNAYISSLKDNKELLAKTNIIMRDFISSDLVNIKTILELNIEKNLIIKTS